MARTTSGKRTKEFTPPPGCRLLFSLEIPLHWSNRFSGNWMGRPSWSPDGRFLAAGSNTADVAIWDATSGELAQSFRSTGFVRSVAWSSDSKLLAASGAKSVLIWDVEDRREHHRVTVDKGIAPSNIFSVAWSPTDPVLAITSNNMVVLYTADHSRSLQLFVEDIDRVIPVAWSPDGRWLASADSSGTIRVRSADGTHLRFQLKGHTQRIQGLAWSPNGRHIASASVDRTLKLWDAQSGSPTGQLEGHTREVTSVSFSLDGLLLASQGGDNTVRIWRCDLWEQVTTLPVRNPRYWPPGLAFHPTAPLLASSSDDGVVNVWALDPGVLLTQTTIQAAHYSNAKIVLVGNTSVGKSGLGLVLAGRQFRPTESTHGRHVWSLKNETVMLNEGVSGIRETLLWDFAGQPGYRLLHQLHLHDVAVALVLFDSRSETDPFAGVPYWAQALNEATQGQPLRKFLVASRADRGGPKVSQGRIDETRRRYGFDGYFETSAKRGTGLRELRDAIFSSIQWDKLPRISTNELFLAARNFLVDQKKKGLVIATQAELLATFRHKRKKDDVTDDVFATCLGGLESTGLIRRLAFGQHVLLQPELLDAYCGWMAFAAREQPDGLGYINEHEALGGRFPMDEDRPLKDKAEEKIILLATAHEIVSRNIGYRQETQLGTMLVFPSELSTELSDYPGGYSLSVAFQFRGPISAIYATLAVTLINSLVFKKKNLFKNAALYEGPRKQVCGFAIEYPDKADEALGRLTVFFERGTAKDVQLLFLRFVNQQLKRLALESTVQRERVYHCEACSYTVPPQIVNRRIESGRFTVICPGCDAHMPIDDLAEESEIQDKQLERLNAQAERERARQTRLTILDERRREQEFHVFLCHNSKDKPVVRQLADKLLEHGILAWVDEKGVLAGDRFSKKLEEMVDQAGALAVLIGPQGMGQWQEMEYHAALQRSIEDRDEEGRPRLRLIPVLLPGVPPKPELPVFLRGMHAIDLRQEGPENREEIRRLVEAITTKRDLFS
jgi:WD40 repeat protein